MQKRSTQAIEALAKPLETWACGRYQEELNSTERMNVDSLLEKRNSCAISGDFC
jgi:hypothetical protein